MYATMVRVRVYVKIIHSPDDINLQLDPSLPYLLLYGLVSCIWVGETLNIYIRSRIGKYNI